MITRTRASALSRALQFPLCNKDVMEKLRRDYNEMFTNLSKPLELPKRLFKSLAPKESRCIWTDADYPLPFLKYLWDINHPLDVNSHGGYGLTKAVHASFIPLIRFLLAHGADPSRKENIAITVAIRRKDLSLVKLLIEPEQLKATAKKRKMVDRVGSTKEMLKMAVKCDARDIVDYFMREKGVVPDMQTVRMMSTY